jgi:chlorophyll/bacteriochlorophyll a synthase
VMAAGGWPTDRSILLAVLYSVGAHGIMTLNDFKSIEGDKQMGIGSLPVLLGVDGAARSACFLMAGPQAVVVAMLVEWGAIGHALGVAGLLVVQIALMLRFLGAPRERATWYSALGINFFVIGMLVSAFALRATSGQAA